MVGVFKFLLLQVITPHTHRDEALRDMVELEMLVDTFGGNVVEKSTQHRVTPHANTYIGEGKVEWLKEQVKEENIDVVVLNGIVNAGQIFRLEKILWSVNTRIRVWDRVDLILNIFEQHASTNEAKLQIELARIQHMGPRIYGLGGTVLSRQGGGIGTKGLGETNTELERRKIKKRTQKIKEELKHLLQERKQTIALRQKQGINTMALVGYTSAGKTSLFNALTSKQKETNKGLFTTLDTVVGKIKLTEYDPTVLISDTIGFIEDLPPALIDAFRSTLLESVEAQMLLHVVDASDPRYQEKIEVVEKILDELEVKEPPLLVFNKSDLIPPAIKINIEQLYPHRSKLFISAKNREGLEDLKKIAHDVFFT